MTNSGRLCGELFASNLAKILDNLDGLADGLAGICGLVEPGQGLALAGEQFGPHEAAERSEARRIASLSPEGFAVPLKIIDRVKERHLSVLEELVVFSGGDTQQLSDLTEAQSLGPIPFDGERFAGSLGEVSTKGRLELIFDPLRDMEDDVHSPALCNLRESNSRPSEPSYHQ